jgi:hypothetical protein
MTSRGDDDDDALTGRIANALCHASIPCGTGDPPRPTIWCLTVVYVCMRRVRRKTEREAGDSEPNRTAVSPADKKRWSTSNPHHQIFPFSIAGLVVVPH